MLRLFLQFLPLALACLALKAVRTAALAGASPLTLLDSLGPDAGLLASMLGAAGLACAVWRGRGARAAIAVCLSLAALAMFLLELVSVSFALETGGALDHHLFGFALHQLVAIWPLIEAAVSVGQLASLALLAVALVAWRGWQIARRPVGTLRPGAAAAWLVAGLVLVLVLPLRVPDAVAVPMPIELAFGPWRAPVEIADPASQGLPLYTRTGHLVPLPGKPAFENAVIVALESTSWFATSLADGGPDTTPFLASLATRGTLFTRAYAVVPHSSKAFVALNCGIVPYLLMEVRESDPDGVPVRCLPDLLREQGFQTLYLASHVGGFEHWRRLSRNLGFGVTLTAEQLDTHGFQPVNYFSYEDEVLLAPTREWLARVARSGRRLYAFYLTSAAHHDYRLPARDYTQRFSDDERHDRYLNAVRYQDRFLEQLLALYREAGLYDRTLFVVVGDHGEAFGEHGRRLHDHVIYEEGIRVPLLFAGAGLPVERRDDPVSHLDVMPSVLRLLGFRLEGGGQDGADAFTRGPDSVVRSSCWYSERCLAEVGKRRKRISHFAHRAPEAFDLEADPRERHDVFGEDPGDAEAVRALRAWKAAELGRWQASRPPDTGKNQ
ncbi:MAG TPA: sulfatase-like hydrolase/transferase [Myxococcota bacterium]|nr:sulfatase-like hydrolase/transferase [Myxococcota bacterium]